VTELALDHDQRDAFVGELDSVHVADLVRREAAADPAATIYSTVGGSAG
jgi:hypothetical protein